MTCLAYFLLSPTISSCGYLSKNNWKTSLGVSGMSTVGPVSAVKGGTSNGCSWSVQVGEFDAVCVGSEFLWVGGWVSGCIPVGELLVSCVFGVRGGHWLVLLEGGGTEGCPVRFAGVQVCGGCVHRDCCRLSVV